VDSAATLIENKGDFSNLELEDNVDGVAIQSDILSEYLKPTTILSKYQNGPPMPADPERTQEEEKEWPINKEEAQFNDATSAFHEQRECVQKEDEFLNEEKSSFEAIRCDDLYKALLTEADREIKNDQIVVADFGNLSWFEYLRLFLCGGCSVALRSKKLRTERDGLFKIAKLALDQSNETHCRMLQTLWMKLTDNGQCAKTGGHWQQIGFQGNDPSTDIRGTGLLGVLQLLFGVEQHHQMMAKIYLLSIGEHQHFPFAVVSFAITAITVRLLRSCLIYNEVNAKKSVLDSINAIYAALFYQFYMDWKMKSRTIIDFDEAQRDLEKQAFSNWRGLLKQLAKRGNAHSNQDQKHLISGQSDDEDVEFGVSQKNKTAGHSRPDRQSRYKA